MKIFVHKVGNKINGETIGLTPEPLNISEEMTEQLTDYFLSSFKSEETYHFYSDSYLAHNPVYNAVSSIFDAPEDLLEYSQVLARHLYDAAENPRIQGGELFVVYFAKDGEDQIDSIGLFKTEKKESFFNIEHHNPETVIVAEKGISFNKIDKAALIYNKDADTGYVINAVDNNKNGDMYYWFEDFLKIKQRDDDYFHTQETLMVFKSYINSQMPQEFEVNKIDQADFLNKSAKYFREKEEFKLDEFANEVLGDAAVVESFNNFKTDYEQDMQVNISEEFPISDGAVKKMQRHLKTALQLDKNFKITLDGDRQNIETGEDERGKFYKFYFEKES